MDLEIQDVLEGRYEHLEIDVCFDTFRKYNIYIRINYDGILYESLIEYNYDTHLTIDANCDIISDIIDDIIISFYRKGRINRYEKRR